jgi:hypothetical protein
MKSDAGESLSIHTQAKTRVQKVAPGERDLTKAEAVALSDIAAGDRVLVRGTRAGDAIQAASLVVMTARSIATRNDAEQQAWRQRGVLGVVEQVEPTSGEVRISARAQGQLQTITIATTSATDVKRYAPDSIRFADAIAATVADMTNGDQVRVLGDKDPAGTRIAAERIVFGTFRTVAGTVISVAPATGEMKLKDLQNGRTLTVRAKPDTQLKKFVMRGPMTASPGRTPDVSAMLDRLPQTTVEELKPGETVIVSSTAGSKPGELTAIVLLAGAEPIIAQLTARNGVGRVQDPLAAASSLDRGLDGMMGMPIQ